MLSESQENARVKLCSQEYDQAIPFSPTAGENSEKSPVQQPSRVVAR
ncbi:MAG: hypothetical protein ACD_75C02481G0005 [uncultured bacterium]|nr:MAG: hypothetical protein ACD_75C02481G0005 [uncultured bacterium]